MLQKAQVTLPPMHHVIGMVQLWKTICIFFEIVLMQCLYGGIFVPLILVIFTYKISRVGSNTMLLPKHGIFFLTLWQKKIYVCPWLRIIDKNAFVVHGLANIVVFSILSCMLYLQFGEHAGVHKFASFSTCLLYHLANKDYFKIYFYVIRIKWRSSKKKNSNDEHAVFNIFYVIYSKKINIFYVINVEWVTCQFNFFLLVFSIKNSK